MTIQTTSSKAGPFIGNGATTGFTCNFLIDKPDDLQVIYTNAVQQDVVLDPSQYLATGFGDPAGVTVTYPISGQPIGASEKITLLRLVDYDQQTSITNQGGFYPQVIEKALDRIVMQCQQLAEKVGRAVSVSVSSGEDPNAAFQSIAVNAAIAQEAASEASGSASDAAASAAAAAASAGSIALPLPLASGGTGAENATDARTNLGLGSAAVQNTGVVAGQIPILDGNAFLDSKLAPFKIGQCYLSKSGANLLLSPDNGNKVVVGGRVRQLPAAGISLAPSGLAAGTTYYIYLYDNGGPLALEASATAYTVDPDSGIAVKSGDATRTLVGMARVGTGPAWVNTDNQPFVISWFNRRKRIATRLSASNTLSTSVQEAVGSRCEAIIWADDSPIFSATGYETRGGAASTTNAMYIDGNPVQTMVLQNSNGSGAQAGGFAMMIPRNGVSEGYHSCGVGGQTSTATSTQSNINTVIMFQG